MFKFCQFINIFKTWHIQITNPFQIRAYLFASRNMNHTRHCYIIIIIKWGVCMKLVDQFWEILMHIKRQLVENINEKLPSDSCHGNKESVTIPIGIFVAWYRIYIVIESTNSDWHRHHLVQAAPTSTKNRHTPVCKVIQKYNHSI